MNWIRWWIVSMRIKTYLRARFHKQLQPLLILLKKLTSPRFITNLQSIIWWTCLEKQISKFRVLLTLTYLFALVMQDAVRVQYFPHLFMEEKKCMRGKYKLFLVSNSFPEIWLNVQSLIVYSKLIIQMIAMINMRQQYFSIKNQA